MNNDQNEQNQEFEVTPEMIEAGVVALKRHYGNEPGEPKEFPRDAVLDVFTAMFEAKAEGTASS